MRQNKGAQPLVWGFTAGRQGVDRPGGDAFDQLPERRLDQPVAIAEVMDHQGRGNVGAARDFSQGKLFNAGFREGSEGSLE